MDAILEATAQVLVQDGYDKTSTNRVAQRAGVSVGSVYQYFPNKEALVGELVDRYSRGITEMIVAELANLAGEPPDVVAPRLVDAMIALKRQDPKLARVLRERFGHDKLFPLQDRVVRRVLEGGDALVVMPTGSGKSLCFQLPALAQPGPGLCLVFSPLIALMEDQVSALRAKGIEDHVEVARLEDVERQLLPRQHHGTGQREDRQRSGQLVELEGEAIGAHAGAVRVS